MYASRVEGKIETTVGKRGQCFRAEDKIENTVGNVAYDFKQKEK